MTIRDTARKNISCKRSTSFCSN